METPIQKFSMIRTFKAPIQLVFEAFSTEEALAKWWGPVESPIDVIKLDFRPNGIFHYKMKGQQISYGIFIFKKITEPYSISWINAFANEKGEIIKPPFEGLDLPREILNSIELSEKDGLTTLALSSQPVKASESEINTFNSITDSMEQGYGGTFGQLESYLNEIQND